MRRKEESQTNNKAKQHSTPKAVTFPKKNELLQVGLEPTKLYTLDTYIHIYMHIYTMGTIQERKMDDGIPKVSLKKLL